MTGDGLELAPTARPNGGTLCACVRPEAIGIATAMVDAKLPGGWLVDAIYTAGSLRYRVEVGRGRVLTQRMASSRGAAPIAAGTPVHVHWRAEDTVLVADG